MLGSVLNSGKGTVAVSTTGTFWSLGSRLTHGLSWALSPPSKDSATQRDGKTRGKSQSIMNDGASGHSGSKVEGTTDAEGEAMEEAGRVSRRTQQLL